MLIPEKVLVVFFYSSVAGVPQNPLQWLDLNICLNKKTNKHQRAQGAVVVITATRLLFNYKMHFHATFNIVSVLVLHARTHSQFQRAGIGTSVV